MKRTLLGLLILGLVAAATVFLTQRRGPEPLAVSMVYGGEKTAFLENPRLKEILAREGVTLALQRAGSIEMATTLDVAGKDCIWPSSAVAADMARLSGKRPVAVETIFSSPIVLFGWDEVAEAMSAAQLLREREGFLYGDTVAIVRKIMEGARWREDFSLPIFGPFRVLSTDPAISNSGNLWAGLLAIGMNGGEPPDRARMRELTPAIKTYFDAMGYMETSSGPMFEGFLTQGMGARPLISGYENQLVEFVAQNAAAADLIRSRIRVIYPEPTVYASHPMIAMTPACQRLIEILRSKEVQDVAWSDHGFRTGLIGVTNDPAALRLARLPETIAAVAPTPSAEATLDLVEALRDAP
ncbi:substrate-binding domain-containing protein [Neomegalonema perideroedes]|uniref:substrate-binding domain-containing protein n=1 Tax=Neomegalonema perideroedes TaxID=217219 RepID=UPI000361C34D|nr:substrate-binding domain-containing protein [Neomegalonema perideroedes]